MSLAPSLAPRDIYDPFTVTVSSTPVCIASDSQIDTADQGHVCIHAAATIGPTGTSVLSLRELFESTNINIFVE